MLAARLVAHAQQHLGGRAAAIAAAHRDDRLDVELEAVFLERALQALQPLDLAALARRDFVARRIHVRPAAALLLRDVARRVRRAEHALGRAAVLADLDEPDADADVEHPVLPGELVAGHGLADVLGDLPRLVERATREQHRELVAADARDGVRIAHALLEQRGDLAQQIVAGDVAARVVDELEAVEIEIADDVADAFAARRVERRLEPPLELGTIDETRQRVVARLIRHLAREPAQLADVVEDHDAARDLAVRAANRRRRELRRELALRLLAQQERAAAEIDAAPLAQALRHGIAERAAIDLVDERQADRATACRCRRCACRRSAARRPRSCSRSCRCGRS